MLLGKILHSVHTEGPHRATAAKEYLPRVREETGGALRATDAKDGLPRIRDREVNGRDREAARCRQVASRLAAQDDQDKDS